VASLQVFNVRYNELQEFPQLSEVKDHECALRVLDLSGNYLKVVPHLKRYSNLETLSLQYNHLEALDGLEHSGIALKECDVSRNRLKRLPAHRLVDKHELQEEEKEKKEFIARNITGGKEKMEYSPSEAETLFIEKIREEHLALLVRGESTQAMGLSLETLNMSGQEAPPEEAEGIFSRLLSTVNTEEELEVRDDPPALKFNVYYLVYWATNITTLKLSNVQLVNDSFCEPREVKLVMDEPGCALRPDDALAKLHHVTDLDLSINNLEVFPAGIAKMLRLVNLNLSHNKIVKADQISGLHKLEVIDLSDNSLNSIPVQIYHLTSVKRLRLNNNSLRQLPPTIKSLVNLQELNVNGNILSSFPYELGALRLQHFRFFDNERLTDPPKEIQAQGPEAVLAYMRARIKKKKANSNETTKVLDIELWGTEGEIGHVTLNKKTTLKMVRETIDLMVDEAPDRYCFVSNNRAVAEAAEEREIAMQYLPMIQLKDIGQGTEVQMDADSAPDTTKEFYSELIRQLRNMHMHKRFEFNVKEGQTHQVFSLDT